MRTSVTFEANLADDPRADALAVAAPAGCRTSSRRGPSSGGDELGSRTCMPESARNTQAVIRLPGRRARGIAPAP